MKKSMQDLIVKEIQNENDHDSKMAVMQHEKKQNAIQASTAKSARGKPLVDNVGDPNDGEDNGIEVICAALCLISDECGHLGISHQNRGLNA